MGSIQSEGNWAGSEAAGLADDVVTPPAYGHTHPTLHPTSSLCQRPRSSLQNSSTNLTVTRVSVVYHPLFPSPYFVLTSRAVQETRVRALRHAGRPTAASLLSPCPTRSQYSFLNAIHTYTAFVPCEQLCAEWSEARRHDTLSFCLLLLNAWPSFLAVREPPGICSAGRRQAATVARLER